MKELPACCAGMHVILRASQQHALSAEHHNCTATAAATLDSDRRDLDSVHSISHAD